MNELKIVDENGSLRIINTIAVESIKKELEDREKTFLSFPVTAENSSLNSTQVTLNNAIIKKAENLIIEAEKPILSALEEAMAAVRDPLDQFKDKAKEYQRLTLLAKKESFKDKAKDIYSKIVGRMIGDGGSLPDGIPPFESVYDESLCRSSADDVEADMKAKIEKATKKYDPFMVAMFTVTGEKNVEKAEKALAGIEFKEEKL